MHVTTRLAQLAVLSAGSLLLAAPAVADIPRNVHDGRSGTIDAGWVRATCATTSTGAKCAIRFREAVRRLDVTYEHGGALLGVESSWDYAAARRTPERMSRRGIVDGITLACSTTPTRTECTITLPGRFSEFNLSHYAEGALTGGLKGTDIEK